MARRSSLSSPLLVLTLGLTAGGLAYLRWVDPSAWNFADLADFVQGGRSVLHETDVYGAYPGILPFNYPPFGAIACVPLGLLGLAASKIVMTALSVASYVVIARVSVGRWDGQLSASTKWTWSITLTLLGLALEPVQRTLMFGQVNLVLAALVLLDTFVVPKRWRGLLIGLAAGVKLTPAIFGLYFLVRRDFAAAARSLSAGAATVVVAWLVLPTASHAYWLGGFDKMSRFGTDALDPANQSLRACWVRLFGGDPGPAYPISAVIVLLLATVAACRLERSAERLAAVTVVATAGLLVSPISWTHHWVWVVPALVVMARRGWRVGVVLAVAAMFLPPMWAASGDPLRLGPWGQVLASSYVLLGVTYLVAMAVAVPRATAAKKSVCRSAGSEFASPSAVLAQAAGRGKGDQTGDV